MIRAARAATLAALSLLMLAGAALAAPKFPPLTGRVVDNAQLLSPAAEAELTAELQTLEEVTGRQFVVATVPDLQGYEIEDFGYQLGRTWGIGDKERDDGVILLVAPKERKVRIEVGYGLEPVLTDALSSLIIQQRILPAFKAGQMEAGVLDGARAVIRQLSLPEDEARSIVQKAKPRTAPAPSEIGPALIFLMFIAFWLIGGVLQGFGRGRRRGSSLWWLLPILLSGGGGGRRGGGGWSGGGFSGGGGSFGGGGASGDW